MRATDGASAGRKPWRYYYVMAFPLGGNSGMTQDKARGCGACGICRSSNGLLCTAVAPGDNGDDGSHRAARRGLSA
jgi:hypothetical protein